MGFAEFEFLIPKRPVSLQAKSSKNRQAWKAFVAQEAQKVWSQPLVQNEDLHLTLVYLAGDAPPDTDNIIKPIQDALVNLVFSDDELVKDVECHRRSLNGTFDLTFFPDLLLQGISLGEECVYVKISASRALEDYL